MALRQGDHPACPWNFPACQGDVVAGVGVGIEVGVGAVVGVVVIHGVVLMLTLG